MTHKLIAVVTGSNRGIGQGIVQLLATTQHPRPLIIYATSRKGTAADARTKHENEIRNEKLDVSDKKSILDFLRMAVEKDRAVDILINNAGINLNQGETLAEAEKTIDVNYRATKTMCELFLDEGKMKTNPGARIVNVSSTGSALSNYDTSVQERFRGAENTDAVDALANGYLDSYKMGTLAQDGWGTDGSVGISYQVSKACVNALTRALARDNPDVRINCCCPGWVDSDMGRILGRPPKTLEEGARIPVRLAVGEINDETGKYWRNDGVFDTDHGRVQSW